MRMAVWAVLAALSAAGWAWALTVSDRSEPSESFRQHAYLAPRRFVLRAGATHVLRTLKFRSTGGMTRIEWDNGALEPAEVGTGTDLIVTLRLDGRPAVSTVRGATAGIYGDAPASLVWYQRVAPGEHTVGVELSSPSTRTSWSAPYVDAPHITTDGLSVGQAG